MSRIFSILLGLTLVIGLTAGPGVVFAQTTTAPDTTPPPITPPTTTPPPTTGITELKTPRNNVKGGSVAARRPGLWVEAGLSKAVQRQNVMIGLRGGATTFTPAPPSEKNVFLVSFLSGLFDNVNTLLKLLLANSTTGGLDGGLSSIPAVARNGRLWAIDQKTYQVLVTFVGKVDKETAETPTNYLIDFHAAQTAALDDTGRIVTATFTGESFPTNSDLTVSAQNISNPDGDFGETSTNPILANDKDKTAPTITTITLRSTSEVDVTFSEVMDKTSAEKATNYLDVTKNKSPTDVTLAPDGITAILIFTESPSGDTLRISADASITDINENAVPKQEKIIPTNIAPAPSP